MPTPVEIAVKEVKEDLRETKIKQSLNKMQELLDKKH